ncbi:MAG: cytochrome c-type biogenesis protein CcmH [Legionellales bacterium]|nr:cytochrome c-type biogenesis protein CcmH [Legionellales bacterium]
MRKWCVWGVGLLLQWTAIAADGVDDIYPFPTQQQQMTFEHLLTQLRCLVCQNQDLADSNAPLAVDLRNEVYQMVLAEQSSADIIDYLTRRYGDFILFQPPLKLTTYILWFAPFGLLALSVGGLMWFGWRRQAMSDS